MKILKNNNLSTQEKIAKKLNVSQMTISRALNNSPKVKGETKKKIIDAAHKLGYSLNLNARNLATGKNGAIGILSPTEQATKSIYFLPALEGIVGEMSKLQIEMIIHNIDGEDFDQSKFLSFAQRIDGLIIFNMGFNKPVQNQFEKYLNKMNIPYVLIQSYPDTEHPFISIDNYQGAFEAIEHLISLEHKNIFCISKLMNNDYEIEERYRGVLDAFKKHKYPLLDNWFTETSTDNIQKKLKKILQLPEKDRPTAFFAFSDRYARIIINELAVMGFSVPEDFSIIGFNDFLPYSEMSSPYITSIRQPFKKLGAEAVKMLTNTKKQNKGIMMKPEFIDRDSCRKI